MDRPRLAVLLSGAGRTLANLLTRIDDGALHARVSLVVADRRSAGGLDIARRAGIAHQTVSPVGGTEAFSHEIFELVRAHDAALVVMAGFLRLLRIPEDFTGRVVNIHPSLIPAFAGHGYYGQRVHEAVLARGCKITGCTVHLVDNEYDHGPIVAQAAVPVLPDDTPDTLAARVFDAECALYPRALADLLARGGPPLSAESAVP